MSVYPIADLPQPTKDRRQAAQDIQRWGFTLLEDAMSPVEVETLRLTLQDLARREKEAGLAFEDGGPRQQWGDFTAQTGRDPRDKFRAAAGGVNQRIWMIINKGRPFVDLLYNEQILAMVKLLLGESFLLSSHGANIAKQGGVKMPLHTDQWWMPAPIARAPNPLPLGSITRQETPLPPAVEPPLISPCACVNVLWYLRDFSEHTGSTRVLPGSHLSGRQPREADDVPGKVVSVAGKAGTALVIDGRIWHGTGANVTLHDRLTVITTFCGPQFRPQENYFVGVKPEILAQADDHLKSLLGYRIWHSYGRTEDPTAQFVNPG